jgi:glycosyltransferase involved in cell wall biosynthesis
MIPTLDSRLEKLYRLMSELNKQISHNELIERIKLDVLLDYQNATIGFRRNILLQRADTEYVCFFDDDDMPTDTYISSLKKGMLESNDCCSLKGIYTVNGNNPEIFEHSIKYSSWKTNEGGAYPEIKYERPPNHLNCIKTEIAKHFLFKDISHGEDNDWSDKVFESGKIKSEYYIQDPIYQYLKIQ